MPPGVVLPPLIGQPEGVQFSRGCPFGCEFCGITKLYSRVSRTKSPEQMVAEFDHLHELGWRGPLFLVDDNFIGNKREVSRLLPAIAEWQKERDHPFSLFTEASANLVRMNDLMDDMIEAGFDGVFVGIETPNPKAKMKKPQNIDMNSHTPYGGIMAIRLAATGHHCGSLF